MNKGIAVAGNMIVDEIKYIENYPSPQTLTSITKITRSMGGLLCNCIVGLAKLDPSIPLKAIGFVGEDEMGEYILGEFRKYHSIDFTEVQRRGITSFTDVMTEPDGGRTFFQYRGANTYLTPNHFNFDKIDVDILHLGYILLLDGMDNPDDLYPTGFCRVLAEAQKSGILTSIDVVSEDGDRHQRMVPPALAYTDLCIVNEIEAGKTTGIELRDICGRLRIEKMMPVLRRLIGMGVGKWAVIHAPEMSFGLSAAGEYVEEASWNIPDGFKKSSVGAGDAFASGILYGAYHDWNLAKSLNIAGAVAAYSLSGDGACDAIKPLNKILTEMEQFQENVQLRELESI